MSSCLFCDIVAGKIPCEQVFSDDKFLAFRDISPAAPAHILIIPRLHIGSLAEMDHSHAGLVGELMVRGTMIAAESGLAESGYRFVVNCGQDGGQTVGHLHLHILGGRAMKWPPG